MNDLCLVVAILVLTVVYRQRVTCTRQANARLIAFADSYQMR